MQVERNLHYGKLTPDLIAKLESSIPGTLAANKYRRLIATEFSLARIREFAGYADSELTVKECFACHNKEVVCPEDKRVNCLCGRTYFKYYDITDYDKFVELSRWNLFWNRLFFKT